MKPIYLLLALGIITANFAVGQNTFPASGKVGIGTITPNAKLEIKGGHGDTRLRLFYDGGIHRKSSLNFWCSEPYYTYRGSGIGHNLIAYTKEFPRIDPSLGASFIRFVDEEIYFGQVNSNGNHFTRIKIASGGNVGIGTTDPKGYKLAVAGKVIAEEVVVKLQSQWPDYVFSPTYTLRPLQEVEAHIHTHGHLPEVPSSQQVEENGIGLGEMNALLLKKVEELTMYVIDLQKQVETLKNNTNSID